MKQSMSGSNISKGALLSRSGRELGGQLQRHSSVGIGLATAPTLFCRSIPPVVKVGIAVDEDRELSRLWIRDPPALVGLVVLKRQLLVGVHLS